MKIKQEAQALLEFIGSFAFLAFVIALCFLIFFLEWRQAKCAFLVFESTHRKLFGSSMRVPLYIQIHETPKGVEGVGYCGGRNEKVFLPYLEEGKW